MKEVENPWSGIVKRNDFRNYAANKNGGQGEHHLYNILSCNDPNCPAELAVHSSVLRKAAIAHAITIVKERREKGGGE